MNIRNQSAYAASKHYSMWINFYENFIPEHIPEPEIEILPNDVIIFIWNDNDSNYVIV